MNKKLLVAFLFLANTAFAQNCITFDARFIDCLNKWVVLPQTNELLPYSYGYVFLDEDFVLTFQKEGTIEIGGECSFAYEKLVGKKVIRTKISPSNTLISVISAEKAAEMQLPETPEWLNKVKKPKENAETYYNFGYFYNEWGEYQTALRYLVKAEELNPKIPNLRKEIAFTYNSLGQYGKALEILKPLREKSPKDAYIYRELIFALVKSGNTLEAAYNLRNSLAICKDVKYNGENCLNVLHQCFVEKNYKLFYKYVKKTKKWNKGNSKALELITKMENEMKQKND